ncbi:MAG: UvrD-helicase domain-containing protein [Pseudomonadota bacterium]
MSSYDDFDAFEEAAKPTQPSGLAARAMAGAMAGQAGPYMDGLNPAQREAVEALQGPVLMLAGAGTGKTKALTTRIAHLLATGTARENEILAVTFTNKAAREMKKRVAATLGREEAGMRWMGTFHSISVQLLRRHAELVGLKSTFTILDTDDQIRLLKQLIDANNIDAKRWPPRMLSGIIDSWKNRAWTPDKVPESEASAFNHKGVELYRQYQRRLIELNATDFGDLLLHCVTIFQTHPDVLSQYQRWFRYILVDEYQDTNVAQYLWLRLLAQEHKNICCVGDDDQSIYGWRGAEVGNILRFEKDFPGAKVVRLEQNYRSTPHILAAASGVIDANQGRLGKTLWTAAKDGEKVRLIGHWDGEEEARWIGDEIEAAQKGISGIAKRRTNARSEQMIGEVRQRYTEIERGANSRAQIVERLKESPLFEDDPTTEKLLWELASRVEEGLSVEACFQIFNLNEIAILVRASHQMRAFEDRFLTIGLPYRVIGGPRFYERMEIRDAMAYFRLAVSLDDDLAFERIVNTPKRGLGDKAVQTIQVMARTNGVSLVEGARLAVQAAAIKGKGGANLRELIDGLDRWNRQVRDEGDTHVELAQMILDESGYTGHWQNDKTPEAPGRLENLKALIEGLEEFENLQGFLEHVSLVMDNNSDDESEKVSIMTLHAAKGLEFPVVFLPGWEDGLFPSQRSMDESGLKGLEEERRLAYVGITRAEEVCTISFAGNRRVFGQWQSQMPSRFIDELPEDHVDVLTTSSSLHSGGYGMGGSAAMQASPVLQANARSDLHDRASKANVYNSPGWRRLQARSAQRGMSQPREGGNMVIDMTATSAFTVGDRVFHQKFGYGEVIEIEGDKLDIEFDKAGSKKVVAKFVTSAGGASDVPF